jgi:Holliday junction resolvase RusA-like endonuclease
MTTIIIPGDAVSRPRQRVGVIAGKARTFTDGKHPIHAYKAAIKLAWNATEAGPIAGPVTMRIEAVFTRPQAKVWKTKPMPSYPHTIKPDCDNVAKSVMDALNGIAYRDDSQVFMVTVTKRVAAGDEQPRTEVHVESWND